MELHKIRANLRADEEGDIGIGTLIIFIAIVLVAAIAASLILYAAALLQQQAERTADDAVSEVSGGVNVVNVAGDRNPDGESSTIVSGYMPVRDGQPPTGGILWNVTASADGVAPLRITLNWTSAVDFGSGLKEEIVYRTSVYDPTNLESFNEQIARNRLLTLSQLTPSYELVRLYDGFSANKQYVDYTVRDDNSTSYAYAVVGVDYAGNRVLYAPVDSSSSTDDATLDEDIVAPVGGSMTSTAVPDEYSVTLFWVPPSDAGSGVLEQRLYRSDIAITVSSQTIEGRTVIQVPVTATLLAVLNSTTSSYVDSPPEIGTYAYSVIVKDRSGNEVSLGALSFDAQLADTEAPSNVDFFSVRQSVQCLLLTWGNASDDETRIAKYLVFRSTGVSALDSVEELMNTTPLAELGPSTMTYCDYSGASGMLYYYAVIAVDAAGNYAHPVMPSNTIQIIEVKVKIVPGSRPILFTSMMIEITDGETDKTLYFNSAQLGVEGADAYQYSAEILRDPEGTFASSFSLSDGCLVKIFIDAGEVGLNLHAESSFSMKFIPSIGQPTLEECRIPYLGTYRYINLV